MGAEERVWWGIRGVLELVDGMVLEIWGLRGTVGFCLSEVKLTRELEGLSSPQWRVICGDRKSVV